MGMISRWIDAQDDEVLERIAVVPGDKWNPDIGTYDWAEKDGTPDSGCLICHAFNCRADGSYFDARLAGGQTLTEIELRYMDLSYRFGDARIGHLISERARRVLEERERDRRIENALRQYLTDVSDYHNARMRAIGFAPRFPTNREPFREEATV